MYDEQREYFKSIINWCLFRICKISQPVDQNWLKYWGLCYKTEKHVHCKLAYLSPPERQSSLQSALAEAQMGLFWMPPQFKQILMKENRNEMNIFNLCQCRLNKWNTLNQNNLSLLILLLENVPTLSSKHDQAWSVCVIN